MKIQQKIFYNLLLIFILVIFWLIATYFIEMNNLWFAGIDKVTISFWNILQNNIKDITATFILIAKSSIITILLGILFGFIIGFNYKIYFATNWFLDFWRSIPPIVMIYVLINLQSETGEQWRIWLVIFGALPIMIMQIADSIRSISKKRFEALESANPSKLFLFKNIIFFEILPAFFSIVRTIISFSIVIIIVSEMITSPDFGIGENITSNQSNYKISYVYAYAILLGLIGVILNKTLRILEQKIIKW